MDMEQFMRGIAERFTQLSPEQQDAIRAFKETEEAQLIAFVLGPEISAVINQLRPPQQAEVEPEFLRG
tara:strand:+ start:388 stop:591 length:204 start_codon:yes stop_codon:yes gene_type:complete